MEARSSAARQFAVATTRNRMAAAMAGQTKASSSESKVLGIDLAAQKEKTFACTLEARGRTLHAEFHGDCDNAKLIGLGEGCRKIAIDAPFGWPDAFVEAVSAHRDRKPWPRSKSDGFTELYFRETDRAVTQDRRPLSVAADKLGITAMRCAELLRDWPTKKAVDRTGAGLFVEVYPAAALKRWRLDPRGYKGSKGRSALEQLVLNLKKQLPPLKLSPNDEELASRNDDAFDALVAALAGRAAELHLTDGPPKDRRRVAQREGWIHLPVRGSLPYLDPSKLPQMVQPAAALAEQLKKKAKVDSDGYTASIDDVLISTVSAEGKSKIEGDLERKGGNETLSRGGKRPKFFAAHSSAALAANSFAPFLEGQRPLPWGRDRFSGEMTLERKCPTVLRGVPPTLDFMAEERKRVLAVESKCVEPFQPRKGSAPFSDSYAEIVDLMSESWRTEYERLQSNPLRYHYLDAPQLVKHYLGLKTQFPDGRRVTLAYLYWEPSNADDIAVCNIHRAEMQAFAASLNDPQVLFVPKSYTQLWEEWNREPGLKRHVAALRQRYAVKLRVKR